MNKKYKLKIEYAIIGCIVSALIYLFSLLGVLTPFVDFGRGIIGGTQEFFYKISVDITQSLNAISNVGNLTEQTDNLNKVKAELESLVAELKALNSSLEKRLAQEVKYPDKRFVYARVRNMSESVSEIIISAGQSQGVVAGDIVVVSNIPVGQVIEVGYQYSKVKLIISNDNKIPVKFADSKLNGFLEYDNTRGFIIRNLPASYNFVKGEFVVATGLNSPYYYGLYIGAVDSVVGSQTDPARTVNIIYPLKLNELEDVFVVLNSSIEI